MKVNSNFIILILVLIFAIYMVNVKGFGLEHFDSKCTADEITKAYNSYKFKPRDPKYMICDAAGLCKNKDYNDAEIKSNFSVVDVKDECIFELVKTWKW